MDYKQVIWNVVKKIPKGTVSTYGTISKYINGKWKLETGKSRITARMVGYALHCNPDPEHIPCHRVVDRNGKLAENFAFSSRGRRASGSGGWREQKRLLLAEGVKFKDKTHVDLWLCYYEN